MACEKYLNALFALCTYAEEEETNKSETKTPMTPASDMDDDASERTLLLQRVLKHLVVQVLPEVTESSVRLRTIWILAQFVTSEELQKVLLGLVLHRLIQKESAEVVLDERFSVFEHVGVARSCYLDITCYCRIGDDRRHDLP